jgi:hypothetical protein
VYILYVSKTNKQKKNKINAKKKITINAHNIPKIYFFPAILFGAALPDG